MYTCRLWNHLTCYWRDVFCSNVMENYLRLLMETVDDLSQDTSKFLNYQKLYGKQQAAKQAQLAKRVSVISLSW